MTLNYRCKQASATTMIELIINNNDRIDQQQQQTRTMKVNKLKNDAKITTQGQYFVNKHKYETLPHLSDVKTGTRTSTSSDVKLLKQEQEVTSNRLTTTSTSVTLKNLTREQEQAPQVTSRNNKNKT
jgi:hypothetical protein